MGMENGMFWSEIGSGFGELGGIPPPRIPRSIPPGVQTLPSLKHFFTVLHPLSPAATLLSHQCQPMGTAGDYYILQAQCSPPLPSPRCFAPPDPPPTSCV